MIFFKIFFMDSLGVLEEIRFFDNIPSRETFDFLNSTELRINAI